MQPPVEPVCKVHQLGAHGWPALKAVRTTNQFDQKRSQSAQEAFEGKQTEQDVQDHGEHSQEEDGQGRGVPDAWRQKQFQRHR